VSALRRLHVRRADGRLVDAMRGFAALWRVLPRIAWLGRLASLGPIPLLLGCSVRRVARGETSLAIQDVMMNTHTTKSPVADRLGRHASR